MPSELTVDCLGILEDLGQLSTLVQPLEICEKGVQEV